MTVNDIELLRKYAQTQSEEAFAELVSRHVNLVYSVAIRQVGDAHLAEEVVQTVFIILAQKAASLSASTIVSGWLCRTARFVSARALVARQRRLEREHRAHMDPTLLDSGATEQCWEEISPIFDAALGQLSRADHDALVVRFIEGRPFREVACALGITEPAAKMRVNRALEKLRKLFTQRGVHLSAAVIAGTIGAHSVQAAPAGLAASVTVAAVQGTTVCTSTWMLIQSSLKHMAWIKFKTTAVGGAIALLTVGTTAIIKQAVAEPLSTEASAESKAYVTPEATLNSLIGALRAADTAKFAAGCTPERARQFHERNQGKSEEELKREAEGMAKAFSKFKIVKQTVVSPSEVHLQVRPLGDTSEAQPGDLAAIMRFKKIGLHWKFDGHAQ